jgi:signal transduction histidine kinase
LKVIYLYLFLLIAYGYGCRQKPKVFSLVTTPDFDKGVSLLDRQNDSAYYYFNKAATNSKDSLQIALAYNYMAVIQTEASDYYGSQESLLTSLKYLDEKNESDTNCLIANYNVLGRNSANLKNYSTAIFYYDRALRLINNDYSKTIALNNKAVAYQDERNYKQAISIYQSILNQSKKEKKEYARILTNLATARWLKDSNYKAALELMEAFQIRKDENDNWGLNSSYAHLSDYYSHSHPDSALIYAHKMYAMAQQLNSPDDRLEALQKLITLSAPTSVKEYFSQYHRLSDSIQMTRNAAKNQFALIRYETEKNKAELLKLQEDYSEEKAQIFRQQAIIAGAILVFLLATVWLRKRRKQMQLESQNAIQQSQLKTSQKVHDIVANGLYHIMTGLEHKKNIDKEELLDEIEILYEKSRDISHEEPQTTNSNFQAKIRKLLTSFVNPDTTVVVAGINEINWDSIKSRTKSELEPVLLELMVNMKKHSSAKNIAMKFEKDGASLDIHYLDDGIGLPVTPHHGNGLRNTENRIKRLGGRITFDNTVQKGLKIDIFLPNA